MRFTSLILIAGSMLCQAYVHAAPPPDIDFEQWKVECIAAEQCGVSRKKTGFWDAVFNSHILIEQKYKTIEIFHLNFIATKANGEQQIYNYGWGKVYPLLNSNQSKLIKDIVYIKSPLISPFQNGHWPLLYSMSSNCLLNTSNPSNTRNRDNASAMPAVAFFNVPACFGSNQTFYFQNRSTTEITDFIFCKKPAGSDFWQDRHRCQMSEEYFSLNLTTRILRTATEAEKLAAFQSADNTN